jgi:DNA-binding transcriptional ArsR family regulator
MLNRYLILFEIFKELFQSEEISVLELREKLSRKGFITNESSKRRFYYYIQKLEEEGFLESDKRGRKKYLKLSLGKERNLLLDDRKSGFMAYLLISVPQIYRNYFSEDFKRVSKYLFGFDISEYIWGDFYLREMLFLPPSNLFEILGITIKAIKSNWLVSIFSIDNKYVKLLPKYLVFRDGLIFIIGLSPEGKEKKIRLDYIKSITPLQRCNEASNWKPYPELFYKPNEKSFVFGITFHESYMHHGLNDPNIIFPTQYFFKKQNDYYIYYLLGFTGDRFAQKFLTILYDEILEPTDDMLSKAHLLPSFYPQPPQTLKENRGRFLVFLETLEKHLDIRNAIVKRKKYSLR